MMGRGCRGHCSYRRRRRRRRRDSRRRRRLRRQWRSWAEFECDSIARRGRQEMELQGHDGRRRWISRSGLGRCDRRSHRESMQSSFSFEVVHKQAAVQCGRRGDSGRSTNCGSSRSTSCSSRSTSCGSSRRTSGRGGRLRLLAAQFAQRRLQLRNPRLGLLSPGCFSAGLQMRSKQLGEHLLHSLVPIGGGGCGVGAQHHSHARSAGERACEGYSGASCARLRVLQRGMTESISAGWSVCAPFRGLPPLCAVLLPSAPMALRRGRSAATTVPSRGSWTTAASGVARCG